MHHHAHSCRIDQSNTVSTTKKRIGWIDIGKGIGIILVSFGHLRNGNGESVWLPTLNTPIDFIYLFHMPLFFFLGGITFSSRRAFPDFLKLKAKTLLIPYYVFSLYFLTKPIAALVRPNLVSEVQANQAYGANIGKAFYDVLIGGQGLWFLWAYFVGELIVYPLSRIFKAAGQYALTGIIFIAAATAFPVCFPHIAIPFCFVTGVKVAGFILLGILCRDWLKSLARTPALMMFAVAMVAFIGVAMLGNSVSAMLVKELWNFLAMFLGVAAAVFLSIGIMHSAVLEHIGRYSLSFYVVNALTLNVGKILFFRVLHIDGQHASMGMQWIYGIIVILFCLALLWVEDLLIRKLIPWSLGIKSKK